MTMEDYNKMMHDIHDMEEPNINEFAFISTQDIPKEIKEIKDVRKKQRSK